jgi:hypothetical protein
MDVKKRENLREGRTIEFEPGIYGKLNKETKSIDLSDGESIPIPKDEHSSFFPENEAQKRAVRKSESLHQYTKNIPFGETFFSVSNFCLCQAVVAWPEYESAECFDNIRSCASM